MTMNKFQNVSFSSVDEFLDFLSNEELKLVQHLRQIILECIPACQEKLAYNVPFYYRHSRICFIWPSSIPWGKVKEEGVMLGFSKGNQLNDELDYLEKGERKQVYTKTFFTIKDIDIDLIKTYLFEAVALDEQLKK